MSDPARHLASDDSDDLVSALEVIEEQPLGQRAAGYAALHEQLARGLEGGVVGEPGGLL